jgi:dolichol-phosphate mannosyltransferase
MSTRTARTATKAAKTAAGPKAAKAAATHKPAKAPAAPKAAKTAAGPKAAKAPAATTMGRRSVPPARLAAMTVDLPTPTPTAHSTPVVGTGAWVVLPTYEEAENLPTIATTILDILPGATLLVVDDASPDGTGEIADRLAAANPRVRVRHRAGKQGLGRAYLDGFRVALEGGASTIVQMDADWSHDPAALPAVLGPISRDEADLVIGSRYTRGGRVEDWGLGRRLISRGGSLFARVVLGLRPFDLTGGFKAWRASTLRSIPFDGIHAGGYVFQIEMTHRASRGGARVAEVPITFRDRRIGHSKMSRRIIAEALLVVVRLRVEEIAARFRRPSAG